MHLFYARFFTKAIRDMGLIDFDEPFTRLFNQGIIIAKRRKMSKSRGNVVTPDLYVDELGADAVRAYLMFVAPWEQGGEWTDTGISGIGRWLKRVWKLALEPYTPKEISEDAHKELLRFVHQTIRRVTQDMDRIHFNTMIAGLMELTNYLGKVKDNGTVTEQEWQQALSTLLLLLAPTAPHITEELWHLAGHEDSVHNQKWPEWDEDLAKDEAVTLVVQVNGKLRERLTVPVSITEDEARQMAFDSEKVRGYLEDKEIVKVIYVSGKLLNLVVR